MWLYYVSVADRLESSQVSHGVTWFANVVCPQALIGSTESQPNGPLNISLRYCNRIGNEGAKAWCLAQGSVDGKRSAVGGRTSGVSRLVRL